MDKVAEYRKIVKEVFEYYSKTRIPPKITEGGYQLIFDEERGHYLLYRTAWKEELRRVHFCIFHIDIINDKLWVQEDATDFDLVGELEDKGIPKSDIVLAFHAPYKRPHTGYAVA
jgi:XisI protein